MYPDLARLQDILVREDYVSPEDNQAAQAASQDSAGYIDFLIRREVLSKPLLGQALAEAYKLPFADLGANPPGKDQVAAVPEKDAQELRIVLAKDGESVVVIATDAPDKIDAKRLEQLFPGKKVNLAYSLPEFINAAFELY
jgi:hypothetical protein